MFDRKTYQLLWLLPFFAKVLVVGTVFGAGTQVSVLAQPTQEPSSFIDLFASFLSESQTAEWYESVAKIDQPSRLGPVLLEWFARIEKKCSLLNMNGSVVEVPDWLSDESTAYGTIAPSLRLALAEQYFLIERYDACLVWCEGLEATPTYSSDLVAYLKTLSAYMTVDYPTAKDSLLQLSSDGESLGLARRKSLAQIRDLLKIEEPKKLGIVAHRMEDIERRLALGEGNQPTQDQQQRVIEELDDLIKQLEEQQQKQQQTASSNAAPSGTPAEESRAGEYKGPGQVDRKRFSAGDPWGALSPAERERLSQGIDRDFPGHYRRLIESYYQRLAEGDRAENDQKEQGIPEQGSKR